MNPAKRYELFEHANNHLPLCAVIRAGNHSQAVISIILQHSNIFWIYNLIFCYNIGVTGFLCIGIHQIHFCTNLNLVEVVKNLRINLVVMSGDAVISLSKFPCSLEMSGCNGKRFRIRSLQHRNFYV